MNHSRKQKKRLLFGMTAAAVAILAAALLFIQQWENNHSRFPEQLMEENKIVYNGREYLRKENLDTLLVLGLDKFADAAAVESYNNDKQADFLILLVFDKDAQKCTALHINRDTMADMNVLGLAGEPVAVVNQQIALAHTYGNGREISCRNAADAVSDLLYGAQVHHYISLTMDAVPVLNDLVGGVEVTVLHDFTGVNDALVQGETVTLKGDQALHYVRDRGGLEDSSNSARMVRQQQYLNALFVKIQQHAEADENFIVKTSVALADYIVSNRSVTQLQEYADLFSAYEFEEITEVTGVSQMGERYMEFHPDETALRELVLELFYDAADR